MPDVQPFVPITISADAVGAPSKLAELWRYRELFYFLTWRDVKVRYAQSVLGIGWAVIQPLFPMVIFTIVFGRIAKIDSDGVPYALFSYVGLVPWVYFSNALGDATGSLLKEMSILSKIYFPRLIIPLTSVVGRVIDLAVSFAFLIVLMVWYGVSPTVSVVALPYLILLAATAACGAGMWLSALAVQYRDVRYAAPFVLQLLMYVAPVVYPTSKIPGGWRYVYAVNPMVGVIDGFRASLLGSTAMPWDLIGIGTASALAMLWAGTRYFVNKEAVFADVA